MLSTYIATLESYMEDEKMFRYETTAESMPQAISNVITTFMENELTKHYMDDDEFVNNFSNDQIYQGENCFCGINIMKTNVDCYKHTGNIIKEISKDGAYRINDFINLNHRHIVLEISHLNSDEKSLLLNKLNDDYVNHTNALVGANYIAIENCDLQGFEHLKEVYLDIDCDRDIMVCPLLKDNEGFYIEDGVVINISKNATINSNGIIYSGGLYK